MPFAAGFETGEDSARSTTPSAASIPTRSIIASSSGQDRLDADLLSQEPSRPICRPGLDLPQDRAADAGAKLLTVFDANKKLSDETKAVLDIIADGDIILAGGHLHVTEIFPLFEEAKKRGVKKMVVNHPAYVIGVGDEEMRQLGSLGAYMEQECGMFVDGRARMFDAGDLAHFIQVAGVDHTIVCADLGLTQAPRPVEGFRHVVSMLLDLQVSRSDIKKLISTNSAKLLNLAA